MKIEDRRMGTLEANEILHRLGQLAVELGINSSSICLRYTLHTKKRADRGRVKSKEEC
jgi:hypothetical protein